MTPLFKTLTTEVVTKATEVAVDIEATGVDMEAPIDEGSVSSAKMILNMTINLRSAQPTPQQRPGGTD